MRNILFGEEESNKYVLNDCVVPGSVLRVKCVLFHLILLTVLESSAVNDGVLQMENEHSEKRNNLPYIRHT